MLAAEREARSALVVETTLLDGSPVRVSHSLADAGTAADLFDPDRRTLLRGLEANPFVLDFEFSTPRDIGRIGLDLYPVELGLTVSVWPDDGGEARTFTSEYRGLRDNEAHVEFLVPSGPVRTRRLRLALRDLLQTDTAKIHVETLSIR